MAGRRQPPNPLSDRRKSISSPCDKQLTSFRVLGLNQRRLHPWPKRLSSSTTKRCRQTLLTTTGEATVPKATSGTRTEGTIQDDASLTTPSITKRTSTSLATLSRLGILMTTITNLRKIWFQVSERIDFPVTLHDRPTSTRIVCTPAKVWSIKLDRRRVKWTRTNESLNWSSDWQGWRLRTQNSGTT